MITNDVDKAIAVLQNDDVVAIPTETVYGLAANAYSEAAVKKIFDLKQRPLYNPLIVHIQSIEFLQSVATDIPDDAIKLARAFWPGPLTLILKKKNNIPDIVTAGKNTVAVRVPNHPLTLELLRRLDFPLAAPSANPFGSISPTTAQHVHNYFNEEVKVILDGGPCEMGIESTIIGFENDVPILYRYGSIAREAIEQVIHNLTVITKSEQSPVAPGMLLSHYAPKKTTYLVDNVEDFIHNSNAKKIAALVFKNPLINAAIVQQEVLSPTGNLQEASKNLYSALHRLDSSDADIIVVERMPQSGLGESINDRLQRASIKH